MTPPHPDVLRIGENVRIARERKGLSQAALAEEMRARGFTAWQQPAVYKTEKGVREPSGREMAALAAILGTTIERFFWLQGEAAESDAADAAIVAVRQSWQGASDAVLRLEAALASGRHRLAQAKASKYKRVREVAGELEAELGESTLEAAVGDGLARLEDGDT